MRSQRAMTSGSIVCTQSTAEKCPSRKGTSLTDPRTSRHELARTIWTPSETMLRVYRKSNPNSRGSTKTPLTFLPSSTDALCLSSAIEDAKDQLAILGHILPPNSTYNKVKSSMISADGRFNIERVCNADYLADSNRPLNTRRASSVSWQEVRKVSSQEMSRREETRRRSLLKSEDSEIGKIEADRSFLEHTLEVLFDELAQHNLFTSLADLIKAERVYKEELNAIGSRMKESGEIIKQLKEEIKLTNESVDIEVEKKIDTITNLLDVIQQVKTKGILERKYVTKETKNFLDQVVKKNRMSAEKQLADIERHKDRADLEIRCHEEVMLYLNHEITRLQALKDYWIGKYYKDNEEMAKKMETLKSSKTRDFDRMQELTRLYIEYEQVCVDERISRQKSAEMEMVEIKRLRATVRLQSWWRGVMVRKGLGPYRMARKVKGKKKMKKTKKRKA